MVIGYGTVICHPVLIYASREVRDAQWADLLATLPPGVTVDRAMHDPAFARGE